MVGFAANRGFAIWEKPSRRNSNEEEMNARR
jgi:hypothetical protein